jgi:hypothetical protein
MFHCTGHAPAECVRGGLAHSFTITTRKPCRPLGRWPPQGGSSMADWWEWLLWIIGVWFGIVAVALAICFLLMSSPRLTRLLVC